MRLVIVLTAAIVLGCSADETDRLEHDRAVGRKTIAEISLVGIAISGKYSEEIGLIITNMCIDGDISHETHRRFEDGTKLND